MGKGVAVVLFSMIISLTMGCSVPIGATCTPSGECASGLCLRDTPSSVEGTCTEVVVCVPANVIYPRCLLPPCPAVPITEICE